MTNAEKKARAMVARLSTAELVNQFELTETMQISIETAMVRGWIMDELEKRNPEAFDAWIDSDEESPRNFYAA
jgi:hypothetical protein